MAGNRETDGRIEPSFEPEKRAGAEDGPRIEAGDRVTVGENASVAKRKPAASGRKKAARGGGSGSGRGARRPRLGVLGWARRGFYWCLVLGIWGFIGVGGIVAYYAAQMPSASTWAIPARAPNVEIVSVSGEEMASRGASTAAAVPLDEMSPYMPKALVAIEDRRFYSHFGVDPIGLARALVTDIAAGHTVEGGSTITQQLAKNLFLSPERTLERKVQEVLLALWLEHKFTKDQILDMYLNRVYFGSGAYGVQAAAEKYFHEDAKDLTLEQAALLAGLVKAPSRLSPLNDPKAAHERAKVVLEAMKESGFITQADIDDALAAKPKKTAPKSKSLWTGSQNYVADMVMKQLPGLLGGEVKQDIIVDTTIDAQLQHDAAEAIDQGIDKYGKKLRIGQGALVALDGTGAVRALVGGRDYSESQYNRAADARRQPGSSFKPFVYTAAMEMGRTPMSVRNDAPIKIGNWTPENYEGTYEGPVTLNQALAHSINTVAAQLVMEVGPKTVVDTAHRLGINSDIQPNASIALGTSEVSLLELTSAYAPFMNGGYKAPPYVISKVTTTDGKVLYQRPEAQPKQVLKPEIIAEMDSMLESVVKIGTGRAARLDNWQMGGKTGTTQNSRDALFVGFTANLVAGIWFGNDDGTPMRGVTGGTVPAKMWHQFMAKAHEGLTPAPLPYSDVPVPMTVPNEGQPGATPPADVGSPVAEAAPGQPVVPAAVPAQPGYGRQPQPVYEGQDGSGYDGNRYGSVQPQRGAAPPDAVATEPWPPREGDGYARAGRGRYSDGSRDGYDRYGDRRDAYGGPVPPGDVGDGG
ncbi:MAG: PBP1A family penicillin-binding protein, partial [Pararhizobium sp.]